MLNTIQYVALMNVYEIITVLYHFSIFRCRNIFTCSYNIFAKLNEDDLRKSSLCNARVLWVRTRAFMQLTDTMSQERFRHFRSCQCQHIPAISCLNNRKVKTHSCSRRHKHRNTTTDKMSLTQTISLNAIEPYASTNLQHARF